MLKSKILHDDVFFIKGTINFAPYAKLKKNMKLDKEAPAPNKNFSFPENCWDIEPINTTVSK